MTLSILWFILIAVLWTGYLFLEGFDFGVGILLKVIGKNDEERTQMLRTIGPRGRQRGLAAHRRWRHLCSIPRVVRHDVLGHVPCSVPHPLLPDPAHLRS